MGLPEEQQLQEVEQRLRQKQKEIEAHVQVLEQELRTVGARLKSHATELWQRYGLWVTLGVLLAGMWTGRRLWRRRSQAAVYPTEGLDAYLATLAEIAAQAIREGVEPEEALRRALAEHPPIVVNILTADSAPASPLREVLSTTLRVLLSEWLMAELSKALDRMKSTH